VGEIAVIAISPALKSKDLPQISLMGADENGRNLTKKGTFNHKGHEGTQRKSGDPVIARDRKNPRTLTTKDTKEHKEDRQSGKNAKPCNEVKYKVLSHHPLAL
jgi:hypothetical protein